MNLEIDDNDRFGEIDPVLTKHEFMRLPTYKLVELTGISPQRWAEYKAGKGLTEMKIREIASKFKIMPGTLLDWMIEWREFDVDDPDAPWTIRKRKANLKVK